MKNTFRLALGLLMVLPLSSCSADAPSPGATGTNREAIVGGVTDSAPGSHPSVVMITHAGGACTASLIAPRLILTARHCVSQNITQGIGCDIYGTSSNGNHVGNDYPASNIKVHTGVNPGWNNPVASGVQIFHPPTSNLCNNDIALVVLNQNVPLTPLPIRLAFGPQLNELTTAVGYGAVNDNQQGSGTRRRRANVRVVSVGQDWNELSGAGEFSVTQSVCSGDSGGPVISAQGAVIGVASRVQQCTDPQASAKYVRLDYHKALIDQAFAAAGATPVLENSTPPPPLVKKAVGDGPCQTGAECASFLCQTNGNYCTNFCENVPTCSSGTVCDDGMVLISGEPITQKLCVPLPANTPCEQCRNGACVNVLTTCLNNSACKLLLDCADACTTEECVEGCTTTHSAGKNDFEGLQFCACSACSAECSTACFGAGGAGGAGGMPASGGNAGVPSMGGASGSAGQPSSGGTAGQVPVTSSGSSGGCAVGSDGRSDSRGAWWALMLALPWLRRRR